MKKIYIIVVLSALCCFSCNKWLDVRSEFDVYEESMFETQFGFYNALNGLYQEMAKKELYGQDILWGAIEAWSRNYVLSDENFKDWNDLANFKYSDKGPKALGESLWLNSYFVIANANNLIQNIENTSVEFTYGESGKNMIKAEAYAIRAMMHFELVRIFAQSPILDNGGVTAYMPYVDKYPSIVSGRTATKEVLNRIVEDLEKAKEWIRFFDTNVDGIGYLTYKASGVGNRLRLGSGSTAQLPNVDAPEFFQYRAHRLNYYAITQLLARVYLYKGQNDLAYKNAQELVDLVDVGIEGGAKPHQFTKIAYLNNPISTNTALELRMQSEIIFGLYKTEFSKFTKNHFGPTSANKAILVNGVNNVFKEQTDCRFKTLVDGEKLTKFWIEGNDTNLASLELTQDIIPLMRFIEAYYIAAEALFDTDKTTAITIFNKAVETRTGKTFYNLDQSTSKEMFVEAIVSEYHREFLGEGQMIYVYKRLNLPIRDKNNTTIDHGGRLLLPVPLTEAGIK